MMSLAKPYKSTRFSRGSGFLLGSAEAHACRQAASACGMAFTGIDVRRRPDGGFAVLECNPSPMFAGIQRHTGAEPVSDALVELLLGGAGHR